MNKQEARDYWMDVADELHDEIATLRAERQQAIDERDALLAERSMMSDYAVSAAKFDAIEARCEQAIDALREGLERLENVDGNLALANYDAQVILRAALVSLGETE